MTPILAATIILIVIGIGELASMWSRARVPGLLVTMLILFIVAQTGIVPKELVEVSTLTVIYGLVAPAIMVHMGTIMPLKTVLAQWKSILIAVGGMILGAGVLLAVLTPIYGLSYGIAGAGPLVGGIVSTAVTTEGLQAAANGGADIPPAVLVIPALILMLQSLPSMPLTNWLLTRFVRGLSDADLDRMSAGAANTEQAGDQPRKTLVTLPKALTDNQLVSLAFVVTAGCLAYYLGEWTGISYSIWGIILGITLGALGLMPERVMEKGNGFGWAMAIVITVVAAPLMTADLSAVVSAAVPVILILVIGMGGILLGGFIMSKLVRQDTKLGMSTALTAMYGFPADYLLVTEVVRANARDAEHAEKLQNALLPPMLIGGFTSVSAGSIVIASVLLNFL